MLNSLKVNPNFLAAANRGYVTRSAFLNTDGPFTFSREDEQQSKVSSVCAFNGTRL